MEMRSFQERLLAIMDRKDHDGYWHLMSPRGTREQLKKHYQQEWEVYVRDFPLFLARIVAKNPPPEVRADLVENLFEEETGKLTLGFSHPELFLRMMEGFGWSRADFENVALLPNAARYRAWLDEITHAGDWLVAATVVTVFVEGSRKDRQELEVRAKSEPPVEEKLARDPLVKHHGLDPKFLDIKRAHHQAEAGHRRAAWKMVVDHATMTRDQERVESALRTSLDLWLDFRQELTGSWLANP